MELCENDAYKLARAYVETGTREPTLEKQILSSPLRMACEAVGAFRFSCCKRPKWLSRACEAIVQRTEIPYEAHEAWVVISLDVSAHDVVKSKLEREINGRLDDTRSEEEIASVYEACVRMGITNVELPPHRSFGTYLTRRIRLARGETRPYPMIKLTFSECLGKGSSGYVYGIDERRALKIFRETKSRPQLIMRERNVLLLIRHPHIVRGFSACVMSRTYACIEMERATYGCLFQCIPQPECFAWICAQLMSAVDCVASMGLIHGDVRALNVLVFGPRLIKLCDFELSLRIDAISPLSWYAFPYPTSCSYAPETYANRPPKSQHAHKTDWWGVGHVLYGCLMQNWDASPYTCGEIASYAVKGICKRISSEDDRVECCLDLIRLNVAERCATRARTYATHEGKDMQDLCIAQTKCMVWSPRPENLYLNADEFTEIEEEEEEEEEWLKLRI